MEWTSAFVHSASPLFQSLRIHNVTRVHQRAQCGWPNRSTPRTAPCAQRRVVVCSIGEAATLPLMEGGTTSGQQRAGSAISYARVLEQAANAIEQYAEMSETPPSLRLTVDFPPERNETRAGTLVSRYENNLNFMTKLVARLGGDADAAERLGPAVEIRDNVNPQGGGEYLTEDEVLIGLRIAAAPAVQRRAVTLLLNTGVDPTTLRQIEQFDQRDDGIVVLINCGLDRMSWWAKRGCAKYIDSFSTAYYLKIIASGGWLLKCGPAAWTVFLYRPEGPVVIEQCEDRPSLVDVEAKIRLTLVDN